MAGLSRRLTAQVVVVNFTVPGLIAVILCIATTAPAASAFVVPLESSVSAALPKIERVQLVVEVDHSAEDDDLGRRHDAEPNPARTSARPDVEVLAPQAIDDVAAAGARGTTLHGTERIAGAGATRGGVLNSAEIAVVRGGGTPYAQSNGAVARVLQQANGRYSVVVDGNRGLITTFQNLSQNSLDRLAKNYGWKPL